MQLVEFMVQGLFGKYNHKFAFPASFEDDSRPSITILHGENGMGKTTVLRMLTCMMRFKLDFFGHIPFDKCTLRFDNKRRLQIQKLPSRMLRVSFSGTAVDVPENEEAISSDQREKIGLLRKKFLDATEGISLTFLPADRTRFLVSDPDFSIPDEDYRFSRQVSYLREMERERYRERERISDLLSRRVRSFIQEALVDYRPFFATGEPDIFAKIIQNLRDIHDAIPSREEVARELAHIVELEKLHRRFGLPTDSWDYRELTNALNEVRGEKSDEHVLVAVNTYAEFLASRANTRHLVAERLVTFEEVMREFLTDKEITVDVRNGLTIRDSTGVRLRETQLSSGEYQLLYLMVSALTTRRRGTVIAIDEPELSMHIGWQRMLVRNLLRCASRAALQLIVATHSPDIAGDYPENMIELSAKGF
ncbi:AAA family ATPase [Nonomuraea sp. B19D2]|uniref:AAA family ATPase n=1 Tax=Nonomuraea sp. B19D2 TaxID=3159561 RepID=UPI0032DA7C3A